MKNKEKIISSAAISQEKAAKPIRLINKRDRLEKELECLEGKITINGAVTDPEYAKEYDGLVAEYNEKHDELNKLKLEIQHSKAEAVKIRDFIESLKEIKTVTEFDEDMWLNMIDEVWVHKKKIEFKFRGGFTVPA